MTKKQRRKRKGTEVSPEEDALKEYIRYRRFEPFVIDDIEDKEKRGEM